MIPKVAHYGGFLSYDNKPYKNFKPGHEFLDFNDILGKCTILKIEF
jgi:hypothetical protein